MINPIVQETPNLQMHYLVMHTSLIERLLGGLFIAILLWICVIYLKRKYHFSFFRIIRKFIKGLKHD